MNMIYENLAFFRDDAVENDHPFTFLARERWIYAALSTEEVAQIRALLDEYFK